MDRASAIAYSSSANLGPGYDVLAVAHNAYYNSVTVARTEEDFADYVKLVVKGLPARPYENTAGLALTELLKELDIREKFIVTIENGIPTGLGLGSSGASASAAVQAIDKLLELNLSRNQLVKYAMLGEAASSGDPHADNVSASTFGGLVIVESVDPVNIRQIKISDRFSFMTIVPDIIIQSKTRTLRDLVPDQIELSQYVQGIRYTSALISGLITGDRELLREGMNDRIVEEARKPLYPFYEEMKEMILSHDAAGSCLSGAGPSVLAVVDEYTDTAGISRAAGEIISKYGHKCSVVYSSVAGGANARSA